MKVTKGGACGQFPKCLFIGLLHKSNIYDACRSKPHFGLTISYDEILRYHIDIAEFVTGNNSDQVPLPRSFNPAMFTISTFDNFYHEE